MLIVWLNKKYAKIIDTIALRLTIICVYPTLGLVSTDLIKQYLVVNINITNNIICFNNFLLSTVLLYWTVFLTLKIR